MLSLWRYPGWSARIWFIAAGPRRRSCGRQRIDARHRSGLVPDLWRRSGCTMTTGHWARLAQCWLTIRGPDRGPGDGDESRRPAFARRPQPGRTSPHSQMSVAQLRVRERVLDPHHASSQPPCHATRTPAQGQTSQRRHIRTRSLAGAPRRQRIHRHPQHPAEQTHPTPDARVPASAIVTIIRADHAPLVRHSVSTGRTRCSGWLCSGCGRGPWVIPFERRLTRRATASCYALEGGFPFVQIAASLATCSASMVPVSLLEPIVRWPTRRSRPLVRGPHRR